MNKLMVALIPICVLALSSSYASEETKEVQSAKLCHISNAGFFATDGNKSILMDALFARGLVGYPFATHDLRREMEYKEGRFQNVRMIWASHYHDDHMKSEPILRHLRHNPDTAIIVTKQAHEKLRSVDLMPREEHRITSIKPEIGKNIVLENVAFPTTLYGISHGAGRGIENMGIKVTVAGDTIMHVGDMDAKLQDLKAAGIDGLEVDWLLMPYWHLMDADGLDFVLEAFKPKKIIPMHFDKGDLSNWLKQQGGIKAIKSRVRENLGEKYVQLDSQMACINIGSKK